MHRVFLTSFKLEIFLDRPTIQSLKIYTDQPWNDYLCRFRATNYVGK